ncbi:MAG: leucine-rich repeat protein [Spirochaetaceae bacterium]|nr:leucine-rich repeat protein [Spirochaetaceae bacterium]
MKKILVLTILTAFLGGALCAQSVNDFTVRTKSFSGQLGVVIMGYKGSAKEVIIPASFNGIPVMEIADQSFMLNNINSVVIPRTVVRIGRQAFYGNHIDAVSIPESVVEIGDNAFDSNLHASMPRRGPASLSSRLSGAAPSAVQQNAFIAPAGVLNSRESFAPPVKSQSVPDFSAGRNLTPAPAAPSVVKAEPASGIYDKTSYAPLAQAKPAIRPVVTAAAPPVCETAPAQAPVPQKAASVNNVYIWQGVPVQRDAREEVVNTQQVQVQQEKTTSQTLNQTAAPQRQTQQEKTTSQVLNQTAAPQKQAQAEKSISAAFRRQSAPSQQQQQEKAIAGNTPGQQAAESQAQNTTPYYSESLLERGVTLPEERRNFNPQSNVVFPQYQNIDQQNQIKPLREGEIQRNNPPVQNQEIPQRYAKAPPPLPEQINNYSAVIPEEKSDRNETKIPVVNAAPVRSEDAAGDYIIETDGRGVTSIISYKGSSRDVVAPTLVGTQTPQVIGKLAFWNKYLASVKIPQTILRIEDSAFSSNSLTEIVIPSSVRYIGYQAFNGNPLQRVTIGAAVPMQSDSFPALFSDFYRINGMVAGTYFYANGKWFIDK